MIDTTTPLELPPTIEWVNTDAGPTIEGSKGMVVVLYFFTSTNVNSILGFRVLKELENKFDSDLAIIGIHCPKFLAEESAERVQKAINRHFVRYPVAQDVAFHAWNMFDVKAWPTFVVISAKGTLVKQLTGHDVENDLTQCVEAALDEAQRSGLREFKRARIAHRPEPSAVLRFPSGILEARGMLYVSDTTNNRVLELNKSGRIQRVFGSGNPGFWDGTDQNSGFDMPRGLAYAENWLYVADSNNHSIRRINLFKGDVETVLGLGKPVLAMTNSSRKAREFGVQYPTGLAFNGPDLFIACAGMNQLWRYDLGRGTVGWFSGSGQGGLIDGEPVRSAFAQPTGLAMGDNYIYVADADGSAIREVRVQTGHVHTRCGQGPFTFGFEDGSKETAKLQFPTDLAIRPRGNDLWIADSLNNAIRNLNLKTGELSTLKINHPLNEPTALHLAGNHLWITNSSAHEIIRYDIVAKSVEVMQITGDSA